MSSMCQMLDLDTFRLQAAYDLIASATKAQQTSVPVPAGEQRKWLAIAARALVQAGWLEAGAELSMQLHDFAFARKAFSRAGARSIDSCPHLSQPPGLSGCDYMSSQIWSSSCCLCSAINYGHPLQSAAHKSWTAL